MANLVQLLASNKVGLIFNGSSYKVMQIAALDHDLPPSVDLQTAAASIYCAAQLYGARFSVAHQGVVTATTLLEGIVGKLSKSKSVVLCVTTSNSL